MANDLGSPLARFCLVLEEFRRTPEGRVRSSDDFLSQFFPHNADTRTDQVFRHIPKQVRGPILARWKIRGIRAALHDSDQKVEEVVHDALVAGDIDHTVFEQGLTPELVVRWVPLKEWWDFWRKGALGEKPLLKAFVNAYELELFDAGWFLDTIVSPAPGATSTGEPMLKGTDVLCAGLSKADLTDWVAKVHASGDGSPKGLVAALGWERIVHHTPSSVLLAVVDALAAKVGLRNGAGVPATAPTAAAAGPGGAASPTAVPGAPSAGTIATPNAGLGGATPATPATAAAKDAKDAERKPDLSKESLRLEELVDDIENLERTVVNGPAWRPSGATPGAAKSK